MTQSKPAPPPIPPSLDAPATFDKASDAFQPAATYRLGDLVTDPAGVTMKCVLSVTARRRRDTGES